MPEKKENDKSGFNSWIAVSIVTIFLIVGMGLQLAINFKINDKKTSKTQIIIPEKDLLTDSKFTAKKFADSLKFAGEVLKKEAEWIESGY
ncbi:hypothetical protein JXB01_03150, partial [Candidatus Micrarchaeota archaeon]|nr:hypothetical protein [Candidatus Micrarchaeota archaeon]